jgi:orotidine-5'-phosphate decarboxylase
MNTNWTKKIAIALDVPDFDSARNLLDQLQEIGELFKVGSQLFTSVGPEIIKEIKDRGKDIFLDLKFHDIPNTVARASESAVELGVNIFNIHISGGVEMMKTSAESVYSISSKLGIKKPILLGVTMLTSIDESEFQNVFSTSRKLEDQIIYMAKLAKDSGLDGVVASPKEIKQIRKACGDDFIILTPGIRLEQIKGDDQKRVMTPSEAFSEGADYIVIGRPVYQSSDPANVFSQILRSIK